MTSLCSTVGWLPGFIPVVISNLPIVSRIFFEKIGWKIFSQQLTQTWILVCFQDENYLWKNYEYRFQSHDDFTKEIFEEITNDNDDNLLIISWWFIFTRIFTFYSDLRWDDFSKVRISNFSKTFLVFCSNLIAIEGSRGFHIIIFRFQIFDFEFER